VGGRGQAHHGDPGPGITEAGDGTAPVLLIGERGSTLPGHLLPPGHQTRTEPAAHDLLGESGELRHRGSRRGAHG
jgi:hypothetical protein